MLKFIGLRGDLLNGLRDLLGRLARFLGCAGAFFGGPAHLRRGRTDLISRFASLIQRLDRLSGAGPDLLDVRQHHVRVLGDGIQVAGRNFGFLHFGGRRLAGQLNVARDPDNLRLHLADQVFDAACLCRRP